MLGRNLGLTISCALGASAFLLPLGASNDKTVAALPFVAIDPKHQYLELPCTTCDSLTALDDIRSELDFETFDNSPTRLLLNFTISEDGQALLLNEEQLFPLDYAIENILDLDWSLQRLPAGVSIEQAELDSASVTPLHITGHVYSTGPVDVLTPDGDGVISIRWQLLALEHEIVTVDEVLIQLLRTGDGELLILSAEVIPTPEDVYTIKPFMPIDAPAQPTKNCKYLPEALCDIISSLDSQFSGLKVGRPGCGGAKKVDDKLDDKFNPFEGRLPTHIRPHFGQSDEGTGMPELPEGGPSFHGRPHRHGHHHHHNSMFHTIAGGIEAILIPVILGLGVGLIVVPLGLLTGRFIGWLWFSAFRGGKRGYSRIALDDSDAEDKRRESSESVEPLPQYENAPAYEDTEKEVL